MAVRYLTQMVAVVALLFVGAPLLAQQPEALTEGEELVVGVKEVPPFVMKGEDGSWRGISIELWEHIADELEVEFRYRELPLDEIFRGVESGAIDVGVGALSITPERERRVDFTHAFYRSGLGIATERAGRGRIMLGLLERLFSLEFLQALGALLVILFVAAFFLWLFERRRNEAQFGGKAAEGLGASFWWAAVTMTTVGYGDKAPVTFGGRVVAIIWMFASVIIVSSFTAAIATSLTLGELSDRIRGPEDLGGHVVGTVGGSTSADYLKSRGIEARFFETAKEALEALGDGNVDAVVYDAPLLQYLLKEGNYGKIHVLRGSFQPQSYGLAVAQDSRLREQIDVELLEFTKSEEWPRLVNTYLGEGTVE